MPSLQMALDTMDRPWPLAHDFLLSSSISGSKVGGRKMQSVTMPRPLLDQTSYCTIVLGLPSSGTEDQLDDQLSLEAHGLGVLSAHKDLTIDEINSSISNITMATGSTDQSPARSHSTAPTSCASSDYRPRTRLSRFSDRSPVTTEIVSTVLDNDRKKNSPIKRGLRKMKDFRKRRSGGLTTSSTLTSISSDAEQNDSEEVSLEAQSTSSTKSNKDSWSPATMTSHHDPAPLMDDEALDRSLRCKEILGLRMTQLEQKARFLEYQNSLFAQLRSERDTLKAQKRAAHDILLEEQAAKNERALEDLEARQLEAEMKMEEEHELEKRAIMLRLRHMEAYCQNPTPPATPVDPSSSSSRPSTDSNAPGRRVTEKDYHSLAQRYRERDIMDSLHSSKINVLRGKQKKALERFMQKKENEMEALEREQKKEIALVDREVTSQETDLRLAFDTRRARLEARWKLQASIELKKMEAATGLKYAPLTEDVAFENVNIPGTSP